MLPIDQWLFWSRVDKSEPESCWPWLAGKSGGYGQFGSSGKVHWAHRLSYSLSNGPIPKGLCVLHSCDNPSCVNPNHLFLGTKSDNMVDKIRKGRHIYAPKRGEDIRGLKVSKPYDFQNAFWSRVDVRGDDDCWNWIGYTNGKPYGFIRVFRKKMLPAHRVSWELSNRLPIPSGGLVCHRCNNKLCVNPSHLYVGTSSENIKDSYRNGHKPGGARGEKHPLAKLSETKIRWAAAVRREYGTSYRRLAERLNVDVATIFDAINGRKWKHLRLTDPCIHPLVSVLPH